MTGSVVLDPLLPLAVLAGLAAVALVLVGLALWRGLSGWWLRGLAAVAVQEQLHLRGLVDLEQRALMNLVQQIQ